MGSKACKAELQQQQQQKQERSRSSNLPWISTLALFRFEFIIHARSSTYVPISIRHLPILCLFLFCGSFHLCCSCFFLNWHAHCIDFSELLASPQRPTSTTQEVVQQEGWLDSLVSKG